ncbi:pyridoxamine 5'-phosphate oxidase family protein [Kineosporia sp. R_H_3]|uniref:pyridoxamine 5'-phosphate oxidase family protein n=1 Tax=Kineosporia sp. R_H_3 TaxID=1961848 RepID=UPI000B4A602C|nr:pyridoxamine 5'-phosphate oxidase family protein [Kineosporia sp. R_H_3]
MEQTTRGAQTPSTGGVDEVARETGAIEVLSPEQCWQLLTSAEVGRLAVAVAGDVDIFPLNFAVDDGAILFRTAEGTKLVEIVMAGRVAFEVDGYEPEHGRAWSVVVKGHAENLEKFDDLYRAQELPLFPWNASPKERFVKLTPARITGRRFTVLRTRAGDEPHL